MQYTVWQAPGEEDPSNSHQDTVLCYVYENQHAWVKWGNARSTQFGMTTGTRQGSILSTVQFLVYMNPLLQELRNLGVGCHVAGLYMGAIGFCDDLLLVSPTRDVMQACS